MKEIKPNAQQCFAFTPQGNFPAHYLNFPGPYISKFHSLGLVGQLSFPLFVLGFGIISFNRNDSWPTRPKE